MPTSAHPALATIAALLLVASQAACGSDAATATATADAAPTANEMRMAQAGSQAVGQGTDTGQAGGAGVPSRAARPSTGAVTMQGEASSDAQVVKRARCFAKAAQAGVVLDANASADLFVALASGVNVGLSGTVVADLAAKGSSGKTAGTGTGDVSSGDTQQLLIRTPLVFGASDCAIGGGTLSGSAVVTLATTERDDASIAVSADLTYALSDATLTITSTRADEPTYQIDLTAAAAAAAAAGSTRTMRVYLNEHGVRTLAATGKADLDVATATIDDEGAVVVDTYTEVSAEAAASAYASVETRTVASGTARSVHNLAKVTADHVFDSLQYDLTGTCSCPVSGSITQTAQADDGSRQATHTYTFSGCGTAKVTSAVTTSAGTVKGDSQVTFEHCG